MKCNNQNAGEYLNRINYNECITLEQIGMYACNGIVLEIPAGLTIPRNQEDFEAIREHYIKSEQYEFECRKFKNCPKGKR